MARTQITFTLEGDPEAVNGDVWRETIEREVLDTHAQVAECRLTSIKITNGAPVRPGPLVKLNLSWREPWTVQPELSDSHSKLFVGTLSAVLRESSLHIDSLSPKAFGFGIKLASAE